MRNGRRLALVFAAAALVVLLLPDMAHATSAGGGTMPWDTPLTNLKNDLTGPVAFTLSLLAFVVAGVALVFGGELSHFIRSIVIAVMVASLLAGIVNVASALGITGAVVF
jgi:type IV secretory pathway VirB2 component (pilin)